MSGQIFILHGDIAQISADALVYSTSAGRYPGFLYSALCRHVPGFETAYDKAAKTAGFSPGTYSLSPGEAFWVPLPHSGRQGAKQPHGVAVVGVIGRKDAKGQPVSKVGISRKAITRVIDMAAEKLPQEPGQRYLIAIPGLRMGAALGRRSAEDEAWQERREAAQAQIEAARDALAIHPHLDAAFVLYTEDLYHLYLAARRTACGKISQTGAPAIPQDLVQAIRDNECVLFIGSGLSVSAGLPSWGEVIQGLADKLNVMPDSHKMGLDYYLDIAQLYRQTFDAAGQTQDLAKIIKQSFGNVSVNPTMAHYLLMALGVRYVVTTNYDTLLERTLAALRRDPVKIIHEEDIPKTGQMTAHFVVKLHGDAETPLQTLVLSRDDYDDFFYRHPAMASLLEGLLLNQTFFFIGYSLNDPNFRQIYSRIARMLKASKRMAYATTFNNAASSLTSRIWQSKQLQILPMPGDTAEGQTHSLATFLDTLASEVMVHPKLFLSSRGSPSSGEPNAPFLHPLRETLQQLGEQVGSASHAPLDQQSIKELGSVLGFLTKHGWRPSTPESAWKTWRRLADQSGNDLDQKRTMLREALKQTEKLEDAEGIRLELEELERGFPL